MIPDRIMRKIERCLALSKSANANEAGIALRQAQALMQQHGLTRIDIAVSRIEGHGVGVPAGKKPPKYLDRLATLINLSFGTRAIYQTSYSYQSDRWLGQWTFVGTDSASRVAAYAYDVMQRQLISDRKSYQSTLPKRLKRTTRIRRGDAFAEAWVTGAREAIIPVELSKEMVDAIEVYKGRHYDNLSTLKSRDAGKLHRHDLSAMQEGYAAGRQVRVHSAVETHERGTLTHE